jgi:hypothetical protein
MPPPAVGLIRNRGPVAAASLNIVIAAATALRLATQVIAVFSFLTTEESRTKRVLSCRRKRRRVGQACQVCQLSGDESGNDHELANTEPSMQPSANQERANLHHDIGRCRRRRRCDADDEKDCSPIVGSDTK